MKNKLVALLVTAGLLASGAAAYAHHSFGSTYIVEKQVTLEGSVIQISYRSPHSFFFIEVPDANGQTQKWSIEGAAPGQLAQAGVARVHLQSWRSRDRDRQSFAQCRQLSGTHDQDHSPL